MHVVRGLRTQHSAATGWWDWHGRGLGNKVTWPITRSRTAKVKASLPGDILTAAVERTNGDDDLKGAIILIEFFTQHQRTMPRNVEKARLPTFGSRRCLHKDLILLLPQNDPSFCVLASWSDQVKYCLFSARCRETLRRTRLPAFVSRRCEQRTKPAGSHHDEKSFCVPASWADQVNYFLFKKQWHMFERPYVNPFSSSLKRFCFC